MAASGGTSPSPQHTQQFLSSVLSQRGPSSLPYSEDVKWLIRQHLLSLSEAFPSLQPKTATFTHNDGRTVNLLQADGTVPMIYQEVTYNIPVVIWLMESYPRHPPLVFVNPTRDMVIKRQHPYVNPSGMVSILYLQNWVYPSSNLVDLARNLSHYFGLDSPLYSRRPPPPNSSGHVNQNPIFSSANSMNTMNSSNSMGGGARPAIPPRTYPASPYGSNSGSGRMQMPPPPSRVGSNEDPTEVYKRNAINKLVGDLHGDIAGLRKARESEMESLFSVQAELRHREDVLGKGLREMQDEMGGLEQQLQMVLMNTDVLEDWVTENEGKKGNVGNVDADSAFEPVDVLAKQMLECTSSDLAIEDTVYALDKAVQEGSIPFDQYLRNVRLLSREQFFHRATFSKVRAAQVQAQVAGMAARAPQYAV